MATSLTPPEECADAQCYGLECDMEGALIMADGCEVLKKYLNVELPNVMGSFFCDESNKHLRCLPETCSSLLTELDSYAHRLDDIFANISFQLNGDRDLTVTPKQECGDFVVQMNAKAFRILTTTSSSTSTSSSVTQVLPYGWIRTYDYASKRWEFRNTCTDEKRYTNNFPTLPAKDSRTNKCIEYGATDPPCLNTESTTASTSNAACVTSCFHNTADCSGPYNYSMCMELYTDAKSNGQGSGLQYTENCACDGCYSVCKGGSSCNADTYPNDEQLCEAVPSYTEVFKAHSCTSGAFELRPVAYVAALAVAVAGLLA